MATDARTETDGESTTETESLTLVQAVQDGLQTEMSRDEDVLVMGEDVGKNGGVFRATEGLYDEFGEDRVIDTPLAESGIVGTAIGMAAYGLRPVARCSFSDSSIPHSTRSSPTPRACGRARAGDTPVRWWSARPTAAAFAPPNTTPNRARRCSFTSPASKS